MTRRPPPPTALALALAMALPAAAQTWSGASPSSGRWSQGSNWVGGQAPGGGATTELVFTGTRRLNSTQDLGSPFALNRLRFDAAAGAFSLSGNALRFTGNGADLTQDSVQRQTFDMDLQIDTALTVGGAGDVLLKGRLVGSGAKVTKTGTGRLLLAQANEGFDGLVAVEGGQVVVQTERGLALAHVALGSDQGVSFAGLAQATVRALSGGGALDLDSTTLTLSAGLYSGTLNAARGGLVKTDFTFLELAGGGGRVRNLEVRDGSAALGSSGLTVDRLLVQRPGGSQAGDGTTDAQAGAGAQLNLGLLEVRDTDLRFERTSFKAGNGSTVATEARIGGGATPGNGLLSVYGEGQMTVGSLRVGVGSASLGRLVVEGGGQLHSTGLAQLAGAGGTGLAEVRDAGSRWRVDGDLLVGQLDGHGELLVSNRARVQVGGAAQIALGSLLRVRTGGQLLASALAGAGQLDLQADPAGDFALVLGSDAAGQNFSGSLTGAGSVRKVGSNTVGLWGGNSFTGRVQVEAGTLQLSTSSQPRAYEVWAGATLESDSLTVSNGGTVHNQGLLAAAVNLQTGAQGWGDGRFGNVRVVLGGQFSPGEGVGTAQTRFFHWQRGGVLQIDFASATGTAGMDWDLLRVDADVELDARGASVLQLRSAGATLAGFDAHQAQSWLIVDTGGGVMTFDGAGIQLDLSGFAPDLHGGQFSVADRSGDLYLVFAPVPEPPAWLLLGAALGIGGWLGRRRGS